MFRGAAFETIRTGPPYDPTTALRDYFSRKCRFGFSTVTIVFGGMLFTSETLAPTAELAPITVSPPRIVALA